MSQHVWQEDKKQQTGSDEKPNQKKVLMPEGKKNEAEEDQGQGPVAAMKLPDQKGPV